MSMSDGGRTSVLSGEKVIYEYGDWVIVVTVMGNYLIDHRRGNNWSTSYNPAPEFKETNTGLCYCCDCKIPEEVITFVGLLEL